MIGIGKQFTDDAAAVVMLCSRLGLAADSGSVSPLTLREWNALAQKIRESELIRPAALLGMAAAELSSRLTIAVTEGERIATLLDRGGAIALEMEELSSYGIWCVTRVDDSYPLRLRHSLKHLSPPVLFGAG